MTVIVQNNKPRSGRGNPISSPRRGLWLRIAVGVVLIAVIGVVIAVKAGGGGRADVTFTINAPTAGATVTSPVMLDISLQEARLGLPENGLGHLHPSLDGGQSLAEYSSSRLPLQIPPGRHTLTVELAGPDHAPLLAAQSVTFTVAG